MKNLEIERAQRRMAKADLTIVEKQVTHRFAPEHDTGHSSCALDTSCYWWRRSLEET